MQTNDQIEDWKAGQDIAVSTEDLSEQDKLANDNATFDGGEIIKWRNHVSYIAERMGAVFIVFGALLLNELQSLPDLIKLVQSGTVMQVAGGLLIVLLLFLIVCAWHVNRWYKTTITVKDYTITIERNTLNRVVNTIAVKNISNINLEQNLYEMIVGTQKLKLDTNSLSTANATDVNIVLKKEKAYEMEQLILAMMKDLQRAEKEARLAAAGTAPSQEDGEVVGHESDNTLAEMSMDEEPDFLVDINENDYDIQYSIGDIIKSCAMSTSIFALVVAIAFCVGAIIVAVHELGTAGTIVSVLGSVVVTFLVAASVFSGILKQWLNAFDFRAKRYKDKIYVRCGLLKKKKYAVPVDKINAIKMEYTFLGRLFGYSSIKVINVGGEEEDVDGMQLLLASNQQRLKKDLAVLLPEFSFPAFDKSKPQPFRAVIRGVVFKILFLILLSVGIFYGVLAANSGETLLAGLVPIWIAVTAGIIILMVIGSYMSYRITCFGLGEDYLLLSSGTFGRTVVTIPYYKIQYVTTHQSLLDRLMGLATGNVSILASMLSQNQPIPCFDKEDLERLVEGIRSRYRKYEDGQDLEAMPEDSL